MLLSSLSRFGLDGGLAHSLEQGFADRPVTRQRKHQELAAFNDVCDPLAFGAVDGHGFIEEAKCMAFEDAEPCKPRTLSQTAELVGKLIWPRLDALCCPAKLKKERIVRIGP